MKSIQKTILALLLVIPCLGYTSAELYPMQIKKGFDLLGLDLNQFDRRLDINSCRLDDDVEPDFDKRCQAAEKRIVSGMHDSIIGMFADIIDNDIDIKLVHGPIWDYFLDNAIWFASAIDDYRYADGDTLLMRSIKKDQPKVVKFLSDMLHQQGIAAMIASDNDKIDIMNSLLGYGYDDEELDESSLRIKKAFEEGVLLETIQTMLDEGLDINTQNADGETMLTFAVEEGLVDVVAFLLDRGSNINLVDKDGDTPLLDATREGPEGYEILKLLLDRGANVNVLNDAGQTPLFAMFALGNFYVEGALLLIEKGVNVDLKDKDDRTLLMAVVQANEISLDALEFLLGYVRSILHHNIDLEAKDNQGRTALMIAIDNNYALHSNDMHPDAYENLTRAIALLIQAGADINTRDNQGRTPIIAASEKFARKRDIITNNLDCTESITKLELLFAAGANIHDRDNKGRTPLLAMASGYGMCSEGLLLLLSRGADIHARDNEGRTALHVLAAYHGSPYVDVLVDLGLDVNARDHEGRTPLICAAQGSAAYLGKVEFLGRPLTHQEIEFLHAQKNTSHEYCIERLIAKGANVHAVDRHGHNASYYLKAKNLQDIIEQARLAQPVVAAPAHQALVDTSMGAVALRAIRASAARL